MPPPVRDAFLSVGHGCHIDLEGDWLHGDLPDLRHDYSAEARGLGHFRFAFNDTMLIRGRKQPLRLVDNIRKAIDNGSRKFRSPAELIEAVMGQSPDGMATWAIRSTASRTASSATHCVAAVVYLFVRRLGRGV
ncbi:hypothetical protein ACWTU6_00420 [Mesorhizobium sp. BHbsci]